MSPGALPRRLPKVLDPMATLIGGAFMIFAAWGYFDGMEPDDFGMLAGGVFAVAGAIQQIVLEWLTRLRARREATP